MKVSCPMAASPSSNFTRIVPSPVEPAKLPVPSRTCQSLVCTAWSIWSGPGPKPILSDPCLTVEDVDGWEPDLGAAVFVLNGSARAEGGAAEDRSGEDLAGEPDDPRLDDDLLAVERRPRSCRVGARRDRRGGVTVFVVVVAAGGEADGGDHHGESERSRPTPDPRGRRRLATWFMTRLLARVQRFRHEPWRARSSTTTLARGRRPRRGSSFLTLASVSRILGILFPELGNRQWPSRKANGSAWNPHQRRILSTPPQDVASGSAASRQLAGLGSRGQGAS